MNDRCPTHDQPWRVIPAGISKKTNRPYPAFRVCPVEECKERPVELDKSDPIDKAISEGTQAPQTAQETVDERSYRIERQHSQHMALLDFQTRADIVFTDEALKEKIDWYMADLDKWPINTDSS